MKLLNSATLARFKGLVPAILLTLVLALAPHVAPAQPAPPDSGPTDPSKRTVKAPDLEPNDGWLNTGGPLSFDKELKGRVVMLMFWTSSNIPCMHALPDLDAIEAKFKDQAFAIIMVHSAKYTTEEAPDTIRTAAQRLGIKRPILIDQGMTLWQNSGMLVWPSYQFIDPHGYQAGKIVGETSREDLESMISKLLEEGKTGGTLATTPLTLKPDVPALPPTPLAFPGKVLADTAGSRLFIADSSHNRIVVASLPGADGASKLIATIGGTAAGSADGDYATASFNYPQGMFLDKDTLYVADTNNHLIRRVDLTAKKVETIAGDGKLSMDRAGGKKGKEQGLDSPWDLAILDGTLYIAMLGADQIWAMNLATSEVKAWAGHGKQNLFDAAFAGAALAGPSGLAVVGGKIFFTDSETSSVRVADPKAGNVKTLMGYGQYDFGDDDGDSRTAHFQDPLGIVSYKNSLLIADTFNHKIRSIDPVARKAVTVYGTGKAGKGAAGAAVAFAEPSGLSVGGDRLYVADRNNHRIVSVNLAGKDWCEVKIDGLTGPDAARMAAPK